MSEEDQHLNADGEVRDCGEQPPQPGLIHYRRPVGVQAVPTFVTPPKYGPPPGFSAEKWRTMSRKDRRGALKNVARTINRVTK